jgi:hypothetical protein
MRTAIICAVILSAATAYAETIIIEYPDHYYVESTGIPEAKPVQSPENNAPPAISTPVVADHERHAHTPASRPVTNFATTPQPVDPSERRAAMDQEIQRLQRERGDLLTPRNGESIDDAARRQQKAAGMLKKINKMSSELLNME